MPDLKQTRGVLFDLDGTLVDSLEDLADSMNEVLTARGFPTHPVDSYRYHVGDGLMKLVTRTLPAVHSADATLVEACMEEMRLIYNGRWNRKSRLYEGIPELLNYLAGERIRLAIFSNKPDNFTRAFYEHFLQQWEFNSVIGATELLPLKPDPAGAIKSAENLALPAESVLYLGDTATDMQTAKGAGMVAVGVLWGFRDRDELLEHGADYIISHPQDLIPLIGRRTTLSAL
ncbi:MAG: HAD family hydrolase [Proteobacteria bacterium]|nr:HAD family hydrolase [Pseudomonadota bacterium]MBU1738692.1 HAD family hydrolase [Pseudomonadota bacterium]